ncbi:RPII140-upstream gene protein isoform X2 [Ptiloglossa arizonensis]|uniref:RPII140-upstream gene protein isoform X2 n=1 Tax=Ptiloglossa arizonensis TaxID=3350558 RepID=UPI003FA067E2
MYAAINRKLLYASFFPFSIFHSNDTRNEETHTLSVSKIYKDRLEKLIYAENGYLTKEVQSIISATNAGLTAGFVLGGLKRAQYVPKTFVEENQATKFRYKHEAQREMNYQYINKFLKGGFSLAPRLGIFCCIFQGQYKMSNYTYAGALTGFLYKLNMGLKGAVAGTFLGTIIGAMCGSATSLILYLTGTDLNNIYSIHAETMNLRKDIMKKQVQNYLSKESLTMQDVYNEKKQLQEKIEILDNKK